MEREIEFQGDKYRLIQNEGSTYSLRRFNNQYKMWIEINFQQESNSEVKKKITEFLSNEYMQKQLQEQTA